MGNSLQSSYELLWESSSDNRFVTAFYGVFDEQHRMLTYCNAGHNPPVLMRNDGEYELLETGGPVLGVFEDFPLEEGHIELNDGLLFCYTDGTLDATNKLEEPFGMDRLIEFLKTHRRFGPRRICTALRRELKEHVDEMPQIDDMTFLALKRQL